MRASIITEDENVKKIMRQSLAENLVLVDLCWNYDSLNSWKASE